MRPSGGSGLQAHGVVKVSGSGSGCLAAVGKELMGPSWSAGTAAAGGEDVAA